MVAIPRNEVATLLLLFIEFDNLSIVIREHQYFKIDLKVLFMFLVSVLVDECKVSDYLVKSCIKIMDFFVIKHQFFLFFLCFCGE